MRKMILGTLLTFVLAAAAGAATLTEKIDRTFDVRPGANLSLSNVNGQITIRAWDQPRIHVVAEREAESLDGDAATKVFKELRVEMTPRNGGLDIVTHHPRSSFDFFDAIFGKSVSAKVTYELTVPRSMNVTVGNMNGRIQVADVTGNFNVETTNGRIELTRCGGSIDASTTNGQINADLVTITKGKSLELETTNGRISLSVPSNLAADVDAGTTNGRIHTDLPVETRRVDRNTLRGKINGGGTPVRLRTTNGSIEIRTR
ncbi:MAG TPA: DUF4097 family beta strand repeat-containing protein [Thermoanaerobaculia bacterium]|nr:DUF4097 family beta strand repeat-containing protein [Thermoanaerobaculia bacterium]